MTTDLPPRVRRQTRLGRQPARRLPKLWLLISFGGPVGKSAERCLSLVAFHPPSNQWREGCVGMKQKGSSSRWSGPSALVSTGQPVPGGGGSPSRQQKLWGNSKETKCQQPALASVAWPGTACSCFSRVRGCVLRRDPWMTILCDPRCDAPTSSLLMRT